MKRFILIFTAFIITSCTNNTPKCNSEDVKKLVLETLNDNISDDVEVLFKESNEIVNHENYKSFQPLFKNRIKYLAELETKIYNIRSSSINKEIKKCECEGEFSVIDKNFKDLSEIENDMVGGDFNLEGFNPTIKYTAQTTDDKQLYITIENYEDFEIIIRNIYSKVLKDIRDKNSELNNKTKNNKKGLSNSSSNLSNDFQYDLINMSPYDIANKWMSLYNSLPEKFKNTIITSNGEYIMDYGDYYGVNKGFNAGCDSNDKLYDVWEVIDSTIKSSSEINAYKSIMVLHYVKSQILKCE